ncbi:MAG: glycosyltransferase family 4 protein [archaeon]|nr:glycosyltransferase family 4 protein [archaeon]
MEVELVLSRHPIWQSLIEYPPDGIRYKIRSGRFAKIYYRLNNIFPLSNRLVHFCNGAKPLKKRPWVVDCESVKVFFKSYEDLQNPKEVRRVERLLKSDACRKIIPLSYASKRTLQRYLDMPEDKIEVVYPAVPTVAHKRDYTKRKGLNSLFIGGAFEAKGGREVIEAFKILSKNYPDLSLIVRGPVKEEYLRDGVKNLTILGRVPRDELFKIYYPNADIFLLPTYMDTVGYVLLEAMAFGIPIITTKHFAVPELVKDAGLLIDPPTTLWKNDGSYNYEFSKELSGNFPQTVNALVDATISLIDDEDLRRKLGDRGKRIVENGNASIKLRNEKLKKIYEDAIS